MNKIVAVIGMCGCGKSEAVKFFEENDYKRVYFGDPVFEKIKKDGLEVNESDERKTRERLRRKFGMGAMAVLSIDKIKEIIKTHNVVIESLYSWEEFKILKDQFGNRFKLLTVHTSKLLRYKRLSKRKKRPLTEEEAMSRDISEIENLNKGGPIAFTDYLVINDSTLDELKKQLEKYI